mmetsp:Transcript_16162/g.37118  ORF Transcript_16162/g.37118 Transcript_16162/m.37118 type:complete len:93 (-) Transcript_16162:350-628(-)
MRWFVRESNSSKNVASRVVGFISPAGWLATNRASSRDKNNTISMVQTKKPLDCKEHGESSCFSLTPAFLFATKIWSGLSNQSLYLVSTREYP